MSEWTVGKVVAFCLGMAVYFAGKTIGYSFFVLILGMMILAIIVWTVLLILVRIYFPKKSLRSNKNFFKVLFRPVSFMVLEPAKNARFECPRCGGADSYSSREQVTGGAVGGFINNPYGPDFGMMRPVSYDTYVKRCKNCNTEMNKFISTDYYNWRERWYNVTYFVFGISLSFILFEIVSPWLEEF